VPAFEYKILTASESRTEALEGSLNQLGGGGWEAIAMWGIKKGITADQVGVLLKRQTA
jgi:hypothetical protein